MARTPKPDGRRAKRKLQEQRERGTDEAPLEPRARFLIVYGGEATEHEYFRYVRNRLRSAVVELNLQLDASDPLTLMQRARELEAVEAHRAARDGDVGYDHTWAVTDVDDFERQGRKVSRARDLQTPKRHLVVTNQCFEVWLVWHVEDWMKPGDRSQVQNRAKELTLTDAATGKHLDTSQLEGRLDAAIGRAERARAQHARNGSDFPDDEPSSDMDRLMLRVRSAAAASSPPGTPASAL